MKYKRLLRNWAAPIGCGLFLLLVFRFVLFLGYVPSSSMEPSLQAGSYILALRVFDEPKKGDVVVFQHEGRLLVKRIVAVPGDCYVRTGDVLCITKNEGVMVPAQCYLVLGDNASCSIDSRYWSDPYVQHGDIVAVVLGIPDK